MQVNIMTNTSHRFDQLKKILPKTKADMTLFIAFLTANFSLLYVTIFPMYAIKTHSVIVCVRAEFNSLILKTNFFFTFNPI